MKMSDSPELTRVHAENLIANYLQPESNTQVNISDALRNSIQKGLIKGNEGISFCLIPFCTYAVLTSSVLVWR
jgi:hypothetical protein